MANIHTHEVIDPLIGQEVPSIPPGYVGCQSGHGYLIMSKEIPVGDQQTQFFE